MHWFCRVLSFNLLAILTLLPLAEAAEQAVCDEQLEIIDQKAAAADHPDNVREYLANLRTTIEQSCAYIDETALRQMVSQTDAMMSLVKTAPSARADPAEHTSSTTPSGNKTSSSQSISLPQAPSSTSLLSTVVKRSDAMFGISIEDWDVYNGIARVLFFSRPSRTQFNHPERGRYLYVATITAGGKLKIHDLGRRDLKEILRIALRRGTDEILVQTIDSSQPDSAQIERWSVSSGRKLAASAAPVLPWSRNKLGEQDLFSLATSDGNVVFINVGVRDGKQSVSWLEATPAGATVGQGRYASPGAKVLASNWFHTRNGGAGIVLDVLANDESGIESALDTPIAVEMGAHTVNGVVGNERRLLVIGDDAGSAWQSTALDRSLMWLGMEKLPTKAPMDELVQRTRRLEDANLAYGANRSLASTAVGGRYVPAVAPMENGYSVLIRNNNRGSETSPVKGDWLLELATDGGKRETYLEPLSRQFKSHFSLLAAPGDGLLFAYALPAVVLFDNKRKPAAYGEVDIPETARARGMLADEAGVWLFGTYDPSEAQQSVWLERMTFQATSTGIAVPGI